MNRAETRIPIAERKAPPPAAYTYFGQFIDHDLTHDETPFSEAGKEPIETVNHRTPWLDLDSLYGEGPSLDRTNLYHGESLRLGEPVEGNFVFDVPMDGKPLGATVADTRNNENAIVRQVHAMFLKLHNAAIVELSATGRPGSLFEEARRRVRWQYQWLVRNDFLKKICQDEVFKDVITDGNSRIDWSEGFSIPVEFSLAAFRFGHSLVRETYPLNGPSEVPLDKLFEATHNGKPLSSELAINWHILTANGAMQIDTAIVPPLFHLNDHEIHPSVRSMKDEEPHALPLRTLCRGAATRLATGEEARDQLCPDSKPLEPDLAKEPWKTLNELGLIGRTPLWYYILLEAEIEVKQRQRGGRLGELGSRLVCEVIEGSLRADPDSYLRNNPPDWEPDAWKLPSGECRKIRELLDVAIVTGLA